MIFYYIIFISYFSSSPSPSRSFPPLNPPNFKFFLKKKTQYSKKPNQENKTKSCPQQQKITPNYNK